MAKKMAKDKFAPLPGFPGDDMSEKWAREEGKPTEVSLETWRERVGIEEVPKGTTEEELKEMINKKWREPHDWDLV